MEKITNVGSRLHNSVIGGALTGANEIKDDTKGKMQNVINQETDAELLRLDGAKQDKLTFDQTPTENSTNPVTSGGVHAADAALQQAIEAILLLIPSAASALNQLADKSFVNSSIATATATFRGTYNLVTDLDLTVSATHQQIATALASVVSTADNNDYCFVQIPVSDQSSEIRVTERYKFDGTSWSYEYDLNNSGFTADQWAAINSGITSVLVGKLGALPTAAELAIMFNGKQNTLTFDTTPTSGSNNPVTSGGLYAKFATIDAMIPTGADANNKLVAESRLVAYVTTLINALDATFDVTSADGHVTLRMTQVDGMITSVQIFTSDIASDAALTLLGGRVSTAEADIDALQDAYAALTQSDVVIVEGTLPSSGQQQNIIYRQPDQEHTPPQYYSDYMWNGTTWVLMATYMNAIDPRPKKGSQNLVTSGGVFDNIGALDVSELNATENPHTLATYIDLSAALAAIPSDYQKGGMSIKFVQSSDNKYVQYRYIGTATTGSPNPFLNTKNWEMAASSDDLNIVEEYSGVESLDGIWSVGSFRSDGTINESATIARYTNTAIRVKKGTVISCIKDTDQFTGICFYAETNPSNIVVGTTPIVGYKSGDFHQYVFDFDGCIAFSGIASYLDGGIVVGYPNKQIVDDIENINKNLETVITKNILDKDNLVIGYYVNAAGQEGTNGDYNHTPELSVNPGDILSFPKETVRFITAYTQGGEAISAKGNNNALNINQYEVPDGIYSVIFTLFATECVGNPCIYKTPYLLQDAPFDKELILQNQSSPIEKWEGNISASTTGSIVELNYVNVSKNTSINFYGEFSQFGTLCVGHGYGLYMGWWVKLTSTHAYIIGEIASGEYIYQTLEHHLTIEDFVNISISVLDEKANILITTKTGGITIDNVDWNGMNGAPFAMSINEEIVNAKLSATYSDTIRDIWVCGDSYITNAATRWVYYIYELGFKNWLSDGYPGRDSVNALTSIKNLLKIGNPKYILWMLGMNDADNGAVNTDWNSCFIELKAICKSRGIMLIPCTIPNTPIKDNTYKNAVIKASGLRYIDFAKAVGAETYPSSWYSGLLNSDNVHPTAEGAKVLASRVMYDFQEFANAK